MHRATTARQTASVLFALLAVLFAGLSPGLHNEVEAVGQSHLEPTPVYFSEHSQDSTEEHLHAETGYKLTLCLACILSLRGNVVFADPANLIAGLDPEYGLESEAPSAPRARLRLAASSRAPPHA